MGWEVFLGWRSNALRQQELPVDTVEISMSLICTVKQDDTDRWVAGCAASLYGRPRG